MMEVLLALLASKDDAMVLEITKATSERDALRQEHERWQRFAQQQPEEIQSPLDLEAWAQTGARSLREMQSLEEKDFVVEKRILACQEALVELRRRSTLLTRVMERRQEETQRIQDRRHDREVHQKASALRAWREVQETV